jgi:hypothetical protein
LSRFSIQGVIGLVVFVAGIVAFHAATDMTSSPSEPAMPATVSEPMTGESLNPSVRRVLEFHGSAQALAPEEMAQIPPTVARTLIEHQVALVLDSDRGS